MGDFPERLQQLISLLQKFDTLNARELIEVQILLTDARAEAVIRHMKGADYQEPARDFKLIQGNKKE